MIDFQLDDLDTIASADTGVAVPLVKTDGFTPVLNANGEQVELVVYGMDSKVYRDAARGKARAAVDRAQDKKLVLGSDASLNMEEADRIDMLAACTKGWNNLLDSKGKPVPFSREAAREFYTRFPAAKEQAEKAVVNRALFTKASSGA